MPIGPQRTPFIEPRSTNYLLKQFEFIECVFGEIDRVLISGEFVESRLLRQWARGISFHIKLSDLKPPPGMTSTDVRTLMHSVEAAYLRAGWDEVNITENVGILWIGLTAALPAKMPPRPPFRIKDGVITSSPDSERA